MKQVAQAIHGGRTRVVDVPAPALRPGGVLVRTEWSLVSPGTERMIVGLAGQSLAGKARSRPDQVRKVIGKVRSEGLAATVRTVRARLDEDLPLGYSAAGTVLAVGAGVDDLRVGDRVACAGAGYACHAEVIFVPRTLVARVPSGLPLRLASTVTLGAIALQGVRRAEVVLGERVGVVGLGLLGLITVQLLRTAGCHVFATDLDPAKVELARLLGAEHGIVAGTGDAESAARSFSEGQGLDAVVVTAASRSSEPMISAAGMCRLGGRISVVGAVGMDLPRTLFYEKELDVRLARSYGPGRYDPAYEEKGVDYPYPYVRFTEGRNLAEFLSLLGRGEVDVEPLLTHEFGIEEGEKAYSFLMSEAGDSALGLLFRYAWSGGEPEVRRRVDLRRPTGTKEGVGVAFIGAGAFARGVLLPALRRMPDFRPTGVVTSTGLTALGAGRAGGFRYAATRVEEVLRDEETDAVVIATRHGDHARLVEASVRAGKDVFVEKPLALTLAELSALNRAVAETGRLVVVGFNRRFAPQARALKKALAGRVGPLHVVYRVNAGPLPAGHWTLDREEGGGRILGEGCHFVDFLLWLTGSRPSRVSAEGLPGDGASATLRFEDGSVGTLVYAVNGDPGSGKERVEAFADGVSGVLDNFRRLEVTERGRVRRSAAAAGKGHREELRAFLDAVRSGGASPVPYSQAAWSTRATLAVVESIERGEPVVLREI